MTRRKILLEKRNRITDTAAEVKDCQIFAGTGGADLSMNIAYLVFREIIRRFAGNLNVLGVQRIVFIREFVKPGGIHRILLSGFTARITAGSCPVPGLSRTNDFG